MKAKVLSSYPGYFDHISFSDADFKCLHIFLCKLEKEKFSIDLLMLSELETFISNLVFNRVASPIDELVLNNFIKLALIADYKTAYSLRYQIE